MVCEFNMMDVSSMYGNHHHHSSNFHASNNDVNATRNNYANAYFPTNHAPTNYNQHVHALNYGTYNAANTTQYQYQKQQQQQQQQSQSQQHATPPLNTQISTETQQQQQQQQPQTVYSHSHLFSPSAAEYGIVSSTAGNTPHSSHSPAESYYESDSMHSYYATAAVASIPAATSSPTIISSENGLSYTNLDCLYNQSATHAAHMQPQYEYASMGVNCHTAEEKYANVLNGNFGNLLDETGVPLENQKHSQMWQHGYANMSLDPALNMHNTSNMPQTQSQLPLSLCEELPTATSCLSTRSQQCISPTGNSTQSSAGNSSHAQSKSPNNTSNLPTYKWMQLKRNVPKPQRK